MGKKIKYSLKALEKIKTGQIVKLYLDGNGLKLMRRPEERPIAVAARDIAEGEIVSYNLRENTNDLLIEVKTNVSQIRK